MKPLSSLPPETAINTNWNVTPKEAVQIQKELREQVRLVSLEKSIGKSIDDIRYVGGADVSMSLFAKDGFAGFVTLSFSSENSPGDSEAPETLSMIGGGAVSKMSPLNLIDHAVVKEKINFPYIPGLLSFREIPMLMNAWTKLKIKPEVIIVDGTGIAHPRRLGIATHLGLLLNMPTIGCAKSLLTGTYKEPSNEPGSYSPIYDKTSKDEIIGVALRSKRNVKPLFISPGHLITLEESIEIVKRCLLKHRVPETTRAIHNMVNKYRIEDESRAGNAE